MIDAGLARRLKLVGLDVDGVLTDNGIYVGMVGDHPVELKRFHIQDGLGIKLLRDAGLVVVLASARRSEATELRARELKVDEVVRSEEHTSELQSQSNLVCRLLLEKKKKNDSTMKYPVAHLT